MQECGECTLCCKLLEIRSMDSSINEWCEGCDPKKGCKVHNVRPDECRDFDCSWRLTPNVPLELRPDKCKVVFHPINDHIMFGLHHPNYDMLPIVERQIGEFLRTGNSVVIKYLDSRKPHIAIAKGHTGKRVWAETLKKYKEYLDDRSKLYN